MLLLTIDTVFMSVFTNSNVSLINRFRVADHVNVGLTATRFDLPAVTNRAQNRYIRRYLLTWCQQFYNNISRSSVGPGPVHLYSPLLPHHGNALVASVATHFPSFYYKGYCVNNSCPNPEIHIRMSQQWVKNYFNLRSKSISICR